MASQVSRLKLCLTKNDAHSLGGRWSIHYGTHIRAEEKSIHNLIRQYFYFFFPITFFHTNQGNLMFPLNYIPHRGYSNFLTLIIAFVFLNKNSYFDLFSSIFLRCLRFCKVLLLIWGSCLDFLLS